MSDARDFVDNDSVGELIAHFEIDGTTITFDEDEAGNSASVGLAVNVTTSNVIKLTEDGESVLGKLLLVEKDGMAAVQIAGEMGLPKGNGATVTPGLAIVGALGASSAKGYIRNAASGTAAELIRCRGIILSTADDPDIRVFL